MRATSLGLAFGVIGGVVFAAAPAIAQSPAVQLAQAAGARDDLLDRLVRRLMICSEVGDSQRRLQCYDQIQATSFTGAGNAPAAAPPPAAPTPPPAAAGSPPTSIGSIIGNLPSTSGASEPVPYATTPTQDLRGNECSDNPVNCAYDPRTQRVGAVTAGGTREVRRQQGPLPASNVRQPLVSLKVEALRDLNQRWVLTLAVTSAASRAIDPSVACDMRNAGQQVIELNYTATQLRPGETVVLDMVGPAVASAYVDNALCRVISPLQ